MNAYHPTRFFVVFSRAAMYLRCLALFICGLFPATALTQNVPPYQSEINQLADRLASENQSQSRKTGVSPKLLGCSVPCYTSSACDAKWRGTLLPQAEIDERGHVASTVILQDGPDGMSE